MSERNIKILEDTLKVCENGYYIFENKKVNLKLSLDEMKECRVFLPQEIAELSYARKTNNVENVIFCELACENIDSFSQAYKREKEDRSVKSNSESAKILVLNFANPVNIGGGVRRAARAQEEDLCRASSLLISLESEDAKRYYEYNRSLDTFMGSDAIIITPNVEIIKDKNGDFYGESVIVSVMTCAAPCLIYGLEGMSQEQYENMFYNRIVGMLRCAAYMGYKKLVLGAFGCGAFLNDAKVVSDLFYKALKNFNFDGATISDAFCNIDFAVLSKGDKKYNFNEFYRNFGSENFYCQEKRLKPRNSKYVFFWHENEENGCFSNWYASSFVIDGITYKHVEQYLMSQKAKLFEDNEAYERILNESSPEICKKIGRQVNGFDSIVWENRRYAILLKGVRAKFTQNRDLYKSLLKTGDKVIAEASPYDCIYGIGLNAEQAEFIYPDQWPGENLLGKALMQIRSTVT